MWSKAKEAETSFTIQWWLMMMMTIDNTMRVHFCLRLLDRAADQAYCHNYPGANRPGNCGIRAAVQVMRATPAKTHPSNGGSSAVWSQTSCYAHCSPNSGYKPVMAERSHLLSSVQFNPLTDRVVGGTWQTIRQRSASSLFYGRPLWAVLAWVGISTWLRLRWNSNSQPPDTHSKVLTTTLCGTALDI